MYQEIEDMVTVTTYKGVVLKENTPFHRNILGHCPYAVYLTNGNRFQFSSIAEFKRVVNATDPSLGIMELDSDGKWHGAGVNQTKFREYALAHQITDGLKFKKPEECNLFSIIEEGGKKYVHVHGFVWDASGERDWKDHNKDYGTVNSNKRNGFWTLTEYSGYFVPIEQFIEKIKDPDYCFEEGVKYQQYEYDCTKKEMLETLNEYFMGHGPNARLSRFEITVDTPCGDYID